MDEEIKRRWVEALRSGEYKQGRQHLHLGDLYCCLGVLYEVAMGEDSWRRDESTYGFKTGDNQIFCLGPEFTHNIGLDDGLMFELAEMNDRGASFEEIADEIERRA